jgi:GT2 family glycosyltransferase
LKVQFIIGDHNSGFAGAHQGMFLSHDAPFVMLLNDDAKLAPDYLERVMHAMESDTNIGSVTGLVYRMDGKTIDTAGLEYQSLGRIIDRCAGTTTAPAHAGEAFGVSGAIGLYRRSAVEKSGGLFDPVWFMYKEDADLAIRLRRAGFIAWYEPTAIAWHKRGLKEDKPGVWRRLMGERHRSPKLREYAYINQHHLYTLHAHPKLGFADFILSFFQELGRTFLVFVTSPRVGFGAVSKLATTLPRVWKRRRELEKMGLPHIRLRV